MARVAQRRSDVLADGRWIGPHGIGRFAGEVLARLPGVQVFRDGSSPTDPLDPVRLTWLVHARRPRVFFSPGYSAPLRSPVPFVFTIHDLIHIRVPGEATAPKRLYYRTVVRPAVHRASRVLTVSEFSRREILQWSGVDPARVTVASPAPSPAFTPDGPRQAPGYPYLLYVGNRKPHKNLPRCLQAVACARIPGSVRLVLSGGPDPDLMSLARSHGVADRLEFTGSLTDEALAAWYRGALALLIPSLYEGFGLPAVEAMACGTPVVAAAAAALPEVLDGAGILVDPTDADAIAAGIEQAVGDEEVRARAARLGPARVAAFTWERTARTVWSVLAEAA